jgi:hypothetical protein
MANTGGFPKCADCGAPIRVENGRDPTRCKACIAPPPPVEKARTAAPHSHRSDNAESKPARKR